MQRKALFLVGVLCAALATAPVDVASQSSNQSESVGANQTVSVGAQQTETSKHEAAKNAINNIRVAMQEMKEQEEILKELVADPSSPRAAYTKFKGAGAPVRAKAEATETKEGGASSTIHKMPGRTKAQAEADDAKAADSTQAHREVATRAECRNNLKQLSLSIDRDADKLHRLFRGTKHKDALKEVSRLQLETGRVRAALKKLPAQPDEKADRAALAEITEALEKTQAAVDKLGRVKVQF